jgi:phosphatidylglycerol lysyltransferase
VAYDLNGRTAIALGDPVGPAEEVPQAIDSFRDYCQRNDWTPAFYQVRPQYLAHYEALGFSVVGIGQEGRIDLAESSLEDPQYQSVLEQVQQIRAAGHRVTIMHPPLPDDLLETMQIISDEWLTMVNTDRKRVWLGWFDSAYVRQQQCAVVYAPDGTVSAFATIIESPNSQNMAIDLLQHRSQVEPGTIALLFHELISWAQSSGLKTLYCGTSPLDEGSQTSKNRLLNSLYQNISRYTFRDSHEVERLISLDWSMRYLAIPGTTSLPAVWGAVLSGDSGSLIRTALKQRFRPKSRSNGQADGPR